MVTIALLGGRYLLVKCLVARQRLPSCYVHVHSTYYYHHNHTHHTTHLTASHKTHPYTLPRKPYTLPSHCLTHHPHNLTQHHHTPPSHPHTSPSQPHTPPSHPHAAPTSSPSCLTRRSNRQKYCGMSTQPREEELSLVSVLGHFVNSLANTRLAWSTAIAWKVLNMASLVGGLFLREVNSSLRSE